MKLWDCNTMNSKDYIQEVYRNGLVNSQKLLWNSKTIRNNCLRYTCAYQRACEFKLPGPRFSTRSQLGRKIAMLSISEIDSSTIKCSQFTHKTSFTTWMFQITSVIWYIIVNSETNFASKVFLLYTRERKRKRFFKEQHRKSSFGPLDYHSWPPSFSKR